jgi:iron(III) transport system permease protein
MSQKAAWFVWAAVLLYLGCFFIWPITVTIQGAFIDAQGRWTAEYLLEVFRNRIYLDGLLNSFWLAVVSSLATLAVALPLALVADRYRFPGKSWLTSLLLVPMILPPFVGAIGLKQVLGHSGALNALLIQCGCIPPDGAIDWLGNGQFFGVVLLNALHLYPILYLNLTAALANIDPAMEEAAENLGCTGLRRFWRITLPLMLPGLFAGGPIVFIFAFTELGTPLVFDYARVTPVQIFYGIKEISGNPFPFALVAVMLASVLVLFALSKWCFRGGHAMASKASTARDGVTLRGSRALLCTTGFVGVVLVALTPHLSVLMVSFSGEWYRTILPTEWTNTHYAAALGHYLTVPSIINSLKYAGISVLIDLLLGIAIAYVVVRTRLPGRSWLDTLAMLPLTVPGLVLAFGYLALMQESRLAGFVEFVCSPVSSVMGLFCKECAASFVAWARAQAVPWLLMNAPVILIVIAYSVRRLPYVVRSAVAGLQQTSETLEEAAANLGCPPARTLRRITLPLIGANLIAGGLLAFSFAMLEVSDSLILAQRQPDFPITKAIYELFQLLGDGKYLAAALGVWAMIFLGLTIYIASQILSKRLGALFRI